MGLQIADAIASSMYFAVEPSNLGFTEGAYGRLLLPGIYRREGQLWGYGLNVFPSETEEKRRMGEILREWRFGIQQNSTKICNFP
jgi:hypothetical protein